MSTNELLEVRQPPSQGADVLIRLKELTKAPIKGDELLSRSAEALQEIL